MRWRRGALWDVYAGAFEAGKRHGKGTFTVAAAPRTEPAGGTAGGDAAAGGDGAVTGGAAPPEAERSADWSQTSLCPPRPPRPPRARRRRAPWRAADGRGAGRAGGENDATYEGEWVQGRRHGKVRTQGLS
jgi:hypothetical protein